MRIKRSVTTKLVIILGLLVQSTHGLADVVATVSYEGTKFFLKNFTFSSEMFSQFFQCLCSGRTSNCSAKYKENDYNINGVQPGDSQEDDFLPCKVYQCKNSGHSTSLICTRMNQQGTTCPQLVNPTFISMGNAAACDGTCVVGISWTLAEERLSFNDPDIGIRSCTNDCCSGSLTNLPTYRTTFLPTYVSSEVSTPEYNTSMLQEGSVESYRNVYIVCGIAAGVFLVTIIVFIIILLLRRNVHSAPQSESNIHSPETAEERLKHIKGVTQNTSAQQAQIKHTGGFGFFNGQRNAKEENGKNGAKSKDWTTNQNGANGGAHLYAQSAIILSNDADNFSDSHRNSSNFEEVYAEIDDSHIQVNEPFYQNNTNVINDRTQLPSEGFSEYSVATPINDDESNEDSDIREEKRQTDPSVGRAAATGQDDHSSESPGLPVLPSARKAGISAKTELSSQKKRNTYFELEKEKEEDV